MSEFIKNLNEDKKDLYLEKLVSFKSNLAKNVTNCIQSYEPRSRTSTILNYNKPIIKSLRMPSYSMKMLEVINKELEAFVFLEKIFCNINFF